MRRLRRHAGLIAQGVLLGLLTAVVILFARETFSPGGLAQQKYREFSFNNSVQAITAYNKRNFGYSGVCVDTALPSYMRCTETGDTFKLVVERITGGYYCADSAGFSGVVYILNAESRFCTGG